MGDLHRVSSACVVLIVIACGCSSTIKHNGPATPGDVSGSADMPSEAAGSWAAPPRSTSNAGSGPSTPWQPGSGAAGTGVTTPDPTPTHSGSAGSGADQIDMGTAGAGSAVDPGDCMDATMLWYDDFETGDYQRWTSHTYNADWGDSCQSTALSTETSVSPGRSQRSEVVCGYTADTVHRGYGGLQFSGDQLVPAHTNQGVGIDAPDGIVNTMERSSGRCALSGGWRHTPLRARCAGDAARRVGSHHRVRQLPLGRDARLAERSVDRTRHVHAADSDHLSLALGSVRELEQRRYRAVRRRQQHLEAERALGRLLGGAVLRLDCPYLQLIAAPPRAA
jgi:hypothetical protein